jgi:flavodoxin
MENDQRILVAYFSLSGNTERVANDLATRLGAECERMGEVISRRGPLGHLRAAFDSILERESDITGTARDPRGYALTVVGTPIWAGKITPAVRAYLRRHRERFNQVAFFTTSGATAVDRVVPAMEKLAGRQAVAQAGFNQVDLKSGLLYEQKINAFLEGLNRDRACEVCGQEPRHAHA